MQLQLKNKLPSYRSLTIIIGILLASYFGRKLLGIGVDLIGRSGIEIIVIALLCASAIKLKLYRYGWQILFLALLGVGAYYFLFAEELIHILFFGALGFSLRLDSKGGRALWLMFAIGIGMAVGDELFQGLLPWRVCDPRDMLLNGICVLYGFFGVWIKELRAGKAAQ